MPGKIPEIIWLYRIVFIDNLHYLLQHGMYHREHPKADPHYINIGDSDLIIKRNDYPVGVVPPGETLGSYIPFYFGPLSPMLLNIKTGFRGIPKRPQNQIVYIVCNATDIIKKCQEWCFTDGHAKTNITEFYNDMNDMREVDWDIVGEKYWHNTEEDFDKVRRKQAEFLVKTKVPVSCFAGIGVYNEEKRILVQKMVDYLDLDIPVKIKSSFYY